MIHNKTLTSTADKMLPLGVGRKPSLGVTPLLSSLGVGGTLSTGVGGALSPQESFLCDLCDDLLPLLSSCLLDDFAPDSWDL